MTRFLTVILVLVATLLIYQNAARLFASKQPQSVVEEVPIPSKEPVETPKHITKTEVYKWIDEDGQVHFSDRTVEDNSVQKEKVVVTSETTEFSDVPKIRPVYIPSNRQTGQSPSRAERCKRLKQQVSKQEAKERKSMYRSGKSQALSDKRWQVIKNC